MALNLSNSLIISFFICFIYIINKYLKYSKLVQIKDSYPLIDDERNSTVNFEYYEEKNVTSNVYFDKSAINLDYQYNPLMRIKYLNDLTSSFFIIFNKNYNYEIEKLKIFYLIFHDFIIFIIKFNYLNGNIKLGIVDLVLGGISIYFEIQKIVNTFAPDLNIINIFISLYEGNKIRPIELYSPEFFFVFELLVNVVEYIVEIIFFYFIIREYYDNKNLEKIIQNENNEKLVQEGNNGENNKVE